MNMTHKSIYLQCLHFGPNNRKKLIKKNQCSLVCILIEKIRIFSLGNINLFKLRGINLNLEPEHVTKIVYKIN